MLKSEDLRFFSIVANERPLAAAARRLNISASAVTQRLRSIERQVGLRLTYRSGRSIVLTDEGKLLAGRGSQILAEIEALDETLTAQRGVVSGHLRILAPFGFGRKHIGPLCAEFQDLNPQVTVELLLTNRLGNSTRWQLKRSKRRRQCGRCLSASSLPSTISTDHVSQALLTSSS